MKTRAWVVKLISRNDKQIISLYMIFMKSSVCFREDVCILEQAGIITIISIPLMKFLLDSCANELVLGTSFLEVRKLIIIEYLCGSGAE